MPLRHLRTGNLSSAPMVVGPGIKGMAGQAERQEAGANTCQRLQVELAAGVYKGYAIFPISPEDVRLRGVTTLKLRVIVA